MLAAALLVLLALGALLFLRAAPPALHPAALRSAHPAPPPPLRRRRRRLAARAEETYVATCERGRVEQDFELLLNSGRIKQGGGKCLGARRPSSSAFDVVPLFLVSCDDDALAVTYTVREQTHQLVSSINGPRGPLCLDVCMSRACIAAPVNVVNLFDCTSAGFNQRMFVDRKAKRIVWNQRNCIDMSRADYVEEEDEVAVEEIVKGGDPAVVLKGVVTQDADEVAAAPFVPLSTAVPDEGTAVEPDAPVEEVESPAASAASSVAQTLARVDSLVLSKLHIHGTSAKASLINAVHPKDTSLTDQSTKSADHRCRALPGDTPFEIHAPSVRFAVATLILRPDQCATYGEGAEVLAYGMRTYVTRMDYELVAMLWSGAFVAGDPASEKCIAALRTAGYRPCLIDPIRPPHMSKFHRFAELFVKLAIFNMVEYEKVVLLDSDVAVFSPAFGAIFETPLNATSPFAAVRDFWTRKGGFQHNFNTGVVIVKPNAAAFEAMMRVCMTTTLRYNEQMSEQGWLVAYFVGKWIELPWYFGANLDMLDRKSTMRTTWLGDQSLVAAVHYTACKPFCGPAKPHGGVACMPRPRCYAWGYEVAMDQWWALRARAHAAGVVGGR